MYVHGFEQIRASCKLLWGVPKLPSSVQGSKPYVWYLRGSELNVQRRPVDGFEQIRTIIADKTHVTKSIWSIPQTVVVAGRATFQDVGWSAKRGH